MHEVHGAVEAPDVAAYEADGVILLRACLTAAEVAALRDVVDSARRAPGAFSGVMGDKGGWTTKFLWQREPAVRAVAMHSRLAKAVADLMRTRRTNLLYDHTCVKEPGDTAPTLWHHDINYLPVEPPDAFASAWVALDDVGARQGRLEFVRGSHRWRNESDNTTRRFTPMDFPRMAAVEDDEWTHPENPFRRGFEALPDIEADRTAFDIDSADVRSGDVLVFHGLTLHYSAGNADPAHRRRAISLRYAGEAARFTPRNRGITSGWPAPGPEALLTVGSPLTCEIWPVAHDGMLSDDGGGGARAARADRDAATSGSVAGGPAAGAQHGGHGAAAPQSRPRARSNTSKRARDEDEDALADALQAGTVGGAKRWRHARGGCAWEV